MLKKTGAGTVTSLSAPGKALAATSINVGSTTNYPTDTGFVVAIRQVDSNGDLVANTYTEWSATVSSATSLAIVATPVYGSDQVYPAGSTTQVYIPLSAYAHNKLIDNILEHANQDGTLISQAVRDALNLDAGSSDGWTPFGYSLTSITALGNRSYTAVVSGVDTTGVTCVGQRLKLPRTVTAPTGSITLNGTSQYLSKTSPAGMGATDDITVMGWIKPTAYQNGGLAARNNGTTDGWLCYINSSGQIDIRGARAADDVATTYQSVPLNKWTHVAITIDSSGAASTAYFDGVSVPVLYTNNGNSAFNTPTAAFTIGATGGASPTNYFKGQMAQMAVYSAVLSAATIRAAANQTLTGSETSLISAYKLDQASGLNDLSANANNLTAQGSPSYSTTQTPFTNPVTGTSVTAGTTNYGIIMAQTFSTNTTYTIQIPEGETLPTTGGLGTVSYSTQKTPYGFPPMSNIISRIIVGANSAVGDYLGMTTTFTANADATYRITVVAHCTNTSALTNNVLSIIDGSTTIHSQIFGALNTINAWSIPTVIHDAKLSAGSHTIKLSSAATGGGTLVMYANGSSNIWATYTIEQLGLV